MAKKSVSLPTGTLEYVGEFWMHISPDIQVNGLARFIRTRKPNITIFYFRRARVILNPENHEAVEIEISNAMHSVCRSAVLQIIYPDGILWQQPSVQAG